MHACYQQVTLELSTGYHERFDEISRNTLTSNAFFGGGILLNATFNNISVISWLSVLLVEETGVPEENHRPVVSHWQTLSYNVVSSTPHHEWDSNSQC